MTHKTTTIPRWFGHVQRAMLAVLFLALSNVSYGEEKFEFILHDTDVRGASDVENGNLDAGIEKLQKHLGKGRQPHNVRVPILIDLCIAHTMRKEFDEATAYCDQAVETGWYQGLAYNTRGVLSIAMGDYEAAATNFELAIEGSGAEGIAKRNLKRAQREILARQTTPSGPVVASASTTDQ